VQFVSYRNNNTKTITFCCKTTSNYTSSQHIVSGLGGACLGLDRSEGNRNHSAPTAVLVRPSLIAQSRNCCPCGPVCTRLAAVQASIVAPLFPVLILFPSTPSSRGSFGLPSLPTCEPCGGLAVETPRLTTVIVVRHPATAYLCACILRKRREQPWVVRRYTPIDCQPIC
jgi:hypothetical protein